MSLAGYFGGWLQVIDKNQLFNVTSELQKRYKIERVCPAYKDVFKAFNLCPYDKLKVVIIGQDPYNDYYCGKPRATGVAFGNSLDVEEGDLSPSLKVLKESVINYEIPHNIITFDNSLESWLKQGILLLNSALTVECCKPESHIQLWRDFMTSLLRNMSIYNTGIIYVLMGSNAQTLEPYINKITNHIIKIKHPSFYARTNTIMPYNIFRDISKLSYSIDGELIHWFYERE